MDSRGFVESDSRELIAGESELEPECVPDGLFRRDASRPNRLVYKQLAVRWGLGWRDARSGPSFEPSARIRAVICASLRAWISAPIVSHYSAAISIGHGVFKAIFEGLESRVLGLIN